MASADVLLISDDGLQLFYHILLERDGVTIRGKMMRKLNCKLSN